MIKILYISSIPLFLILILIIGVLIFTYKAPVINQDMTKTSDNLIKNSPTPNSPDISVNSSQPEMSSDIWKNNIFDSTKAASADASGGSLSLKDVTLVGVFGNGPVAGGVFIMNASSNAGGGGRPYNAPYSQGGGSYGTPQGQESPPKPKMIFLVGERLPNGFMVKSVTKNSVVLQGGDGTVTLDIQYADENSSKRLAEAQKSNVQQQVRIIEAGGQGSSGGGSSSNSNSSNIVIRNTPDQKQGN